jgi:ferredoxin-NADP reductase
MRHRHPRGVRYKNGNEIVLLAAIPSMTLSQSPIKNALKLRVSSVAAETDDIKRYELVPATTKSLPPFSAGAHIDIITSNQMRRSYSLANSPSERHRYVIAVLREATGRGGSAWIHDNVKEGDELTVIEPLNNFELVEDASEHVLIAGGIGVTPILAMGHRLREIGAKARLHYCTRAAEKTAFRDEVAKVFGADVFMYHDGGDPSKGVRLADIVKSQPAGAHLYVCGPTGLMEAAKKAAAHWTEGTVHFEHFKPTEKLAPAAGDQPFEIVLSRSKLRLIVPADKTILEVVRAAGINADSSCEAGICSTCETRLIAGRADHRDEILTAADKAANQKVMICVSRAQPGETLVIDL